MQLCSILNPEASDVTSRDPGSEKVSPVGCLSSQLAMHDGFVVVINDVAANSEVDVPAVLKKSPPEPGTSAKGLEQSTTSMMMSWLTS